LRDVREQRTGVLETRGFRIPGPRSRLLWPALVVTGVFSYLALRDVRFDEVREALAATDYWWLLPALGALAAAIFLRGARWHTLFARETRPPLRAVQEALLISYLFNNILPARAGEVARVVALRRRAGTPKAEALATVVADRTYDVLTLLLLLFVASPWLPEVTWLRAAAVVAVVLVAAVLAAILSFAFFGARPARFVLRPLARLPFMSDERAALAAENLTHGFAAFRRPKLALAALAYTTASWIATAVSFWFILVAFDLDVSPLAALLVVVAIGVALVLPSLPAAVGVFEGATLVALAAYDVPRSEALSYALVAHGVNFFPFLAAGAIALYASTSRAPTSK